MMQGMLTNDVQMVRLTIRATNEKVPPVLLKMMEERLSQGVSIRPERYENPTANDISESFRNIMVR